MPVSGGARVPTRWRIRAAGLRTVIASLYVALNSCEAEAALDGRSAGHALDRPMLRKRSDRPICSSCIRRTANGWRTLSDGLNTHRLGFGL